MMKTKVTISIPAYNDEDSLSLIIKDIEALSGEVKDIDFKVLIINDGSQDHTLNTARAYAQSNKNVTVVNHPENLGFGPTYKEVFTLPETEWIFFLPGDRQFPADNFKIMCKYMNSFDIILGKRETREDSLGRRITSRVYNFIISSLSIQKIEDVNSILLFKKEITSTIQLNSRTAFINAELVLKSLRKFRFAEVGVPHLERAYGTGSGNKISVILPVIKDVVKYMFKRI